MEKVIVKFTHDGGRHEQTTLTVSDRSSSTVLRALHSRNPGYQNIQIMDIRNP